MKDKLDFEKSGFDETKITPEEMKQLTSQGFPQGFIDLMLENKAGGKMDKYLYEMDKTSGKGVYGGTGKLMSEAKRQKSKKNRKKRNR